MVICKFDCSKGRVTRQITQLIAMKVQRNDIIVVYLDGPVTGGGGFLGKFPVPKLDYSPFFKM